MDGWTLSYAEPIPCNDYARFVIVDSRSAFESKNESQLQRIADEVIAVVRQQCPQASRVILQSKKARSQRLMRATSASAPEPPTRIPEPASREVVSAVATPLPPPSPIPSAPPASSTVVSLPPLDAYASPPLTSVAAIKNPQKVCEALLPWLGRIHQEFPRVRQGLGFRLVGNDVLDGLRVFNDEDFVQVFGRPYDSSAEWRKYVYDNKIGPCLGQVFLGGGRPRPNSLHIQFGTYDGLFDAAFESAGNSEYVAEVAELVVESRRGRAWMREMIAQTSFASVSVASLASLSKDLEDAPDKLRRLWPSEVQHFVSTLGARHDSLTRLVAERFREGIDDEYGDTITDARRLEKDYKELIGLLAKFDSNLVDGVEEAYTAKQERLLTDVLDVWRAKLVQIPETLQGAGEVLEWRSSLDHDLAGLTAEPSVARLREEGLARRVAILRAVLPDWKAGLQGKLTSPAAIEQARSDLDALFGETNEREREVYPDYAAFLSTAQARLEQATQDEEWRQTLWVGSKSSEGESPRDADSAGARRLLAGLQKAEGVSRQQALHALAPFNVNVSATKLIDSVLSPESQRKAVQDAMTQLGFSTADDGTSLNIRLFPLSGEITVTSSLRNEGLSESRQIHLFWGWASVGTPSIVLRDGTFEWQRGIIASAVGARGALDQASPEVIEELLVEVVRLLVADAQLDQGPSLSQAHWEALFADAGLAVNQAVAVELVRRLDSGEASRRPPKQIAGIEAGDSPLDRNGAVDVSMNLQDWMARAVGAIDPDMVALARHGGFRFDPAKYWRDRLSQLNVVLDDSGQAALLPRIEFQLSGHPTEVLKSSTMMGVVSRTFLTEPNCLFSSASGLLRTECQTGVVFSADFAHLVGPEANKVSNPDSDFVNVARKLTREAAEGFFEGAQPWPSSAVVSARVAAEYSQLNAQAGLGEFRPLLWRQNGSGHIAGIDPETLQLVVYPASRLSINSFLDSRMEAVRRGRNPNATVERLVEELKKRNPAYRLAMDGYSNVYPGMRDFPQALFDAPEMKLLDMNYAPVTDLLDIVVEDVEGTFSYQDIVEIYDKINPRRAHDDLLLLFKDKHGRTFVAGYPDRDDSHLHVIELPWREFQQDVEARRIDELPAKYPAWRLALNYTGLIDGWGIKVDRLVERALLSLQLSEIKRRLENGQSLRQ